MLIMKFGGSSMAGAERMKRVTELVLEQYKQGEKPLVVVCSAMQGVTDQLVELSHRAASGESYQELLERFIQLHIVCARELFSDAKQSSVQSQLQQLFGDLTDFLHGLFLIRECSDRSKDFAMSFGERLSSFLLYEYVRLFEPSVQLIDTREIVKTDAHFGNATVLEDETFSCIRKAVAQAPFHIATGFIGSTLQQETTTLGRGGSDYTASLFGAALRASEIQIWTDVDGMLTADPRVVEDSRLIPQMSYEEAMEMSHFGAKVIYPPTLQPAMDLGIPIRIKNTFNPSCSGTLICPDSSFFEEKQPVTGISTIKQVVCLRIHGSGMVGVSGTAARLFQALARVEVNVMMITQGSSEHSICVIVRPEDADRAFVALKEEFSFQLFHHQIEEIVREDRLSIIAIVGDGMCRHAGISGRLFHILGEKHINVVAIAQGSSERNISLVILENDVESAMRAIHQEFFQLNENPLLFQRSQQETAHLFLVGTGTVGSALIDQIRERSSHTLFCLSALSNSKHMLINREGIDFFQWSNQLDRSQVKTQLNELVNVIFSHPARKKIFVDCTASDEVPLYYETLMKNQVAVVVSNKRAIAGSRQTYAALKPFFSSGQLRYETTVGAGLPVIKTIRELIQTGDEIKEIQGVLSGTLSFLFNHFDGIRPLSELLLEAMEHGYTEPDPREDLSGNDVARKALILAREIGFDLEFTDVFVENLVPEPLRIFETVEQFLNQLSRLDPFFSDRLSKAKREGKVLRYLAAIHDGQAHVSLESVDSSHPAFSLTGSENLIMIRTKRYDQYPLVIRGPGAGPEVTAAGVMADILSFI